MSNNTSMLEHSTHKQLTNIPANVFPTHKSVFILATFQRSRSGNPAHDHNSFFQPLLLSASLCYMKVALSIFLWGPLKGRSCSVDCDGFTPLVAASVEGFGNVAEELSKLHANVEAEDRI